MINCRRVCYNSLRSPTPTTQELPVNDEGCSPKVIHLNIPSTQSSHKYCIVCKRKSSKHVKLCTVPLTARTQAFIYNGIFIKSSPRCCSAHLQGQNFLQPSLAVLEAKYEKSLFNRTDLVNLLENVRLTLKKSFTLDFDNGDRLTTNRGLLQSDWFNQRTI